MEEKKLYLGYLVLPKDENCQASSMANQKKEIKKLVRVKSGKLIKITKENTVLTKSLKKECFAEIAQDCKENGITIVIARLELIQDQMNILIPLIESGVEFIVANSSSDSPEYYKGILYKTRADHHKKSVGTRNGLMNAKAEGKDLGNPQNLSKEGRKKGNRNAKIKALHRNLERYKTIKKLDKAGFRYKNIAKILYKLGLKTPRGSDYKKQSVYNTLKQYKENEDLVKEIGIENLDCSADLSKYLK